MTLDLFDAPVLPGLRSATEFLDVADERMLIGHIDSTDLVPFQFQGWTGKRLTASFGWSYDFAIGRPKEAPPMPDWLLPFRDRAARFAGLDPAELIQALLTRYDPGAGIGWHRDRPIYGHVIGHLSRRAGNDALSAPAGRGVRPCLGAARSAWNLSHGRRGSPRLGAQHRRDGAAPVVNYLPHARGQRLTREAWASAAGCPCCPGG